MPPVCVQVIESTQELGNDLAGVMALQRKLTGMERDLVAIQDKLSDLGKEAERLGSEHPEQSEAIKGRLAEITGVWDEMKVGFSPRVCIQLPNGEFGAANHLLAVFRTP